MNCATPLLLLGVVVASLTAAGPVPAGLSALSADARLDGSLAAWCRGEFRPGRPGAYAAAVASAGAGGRYVVLQPNAKVVELASFTGTPQLACYSRAEAERLHAGIRESETIEGEVAPRWSTTVVCAFVDDTTATCWQYSPADRTFVKVGGWVT